LPPRSVVVTLELELLLDELLLLEETMLLLLGLVAIELLELLLEL
jgi:hypothetical protein